MCVSLFSSCEAWKLTLTIADYPERVSLGGRRRDAVSKELTVSLQPLRRYDIGRDEFIGNATVSGGTTSPTTGKIYTATSTLQTFLTVNSSAGINHGIATDGQVAIFTVKVAAGTSTAAGASSCVLLPSVPARFGS